MRVRLNGIGLDKVGLDGIRWDRVGLGWIEWDRVGLGCGLRGRVLSSSNIFYKFLLISFFQNFSLKLHPDMQRSFAHDKLCLCELIR